MLLLLLLLLLLLVTGSQCVLLLLALITKTPTTYLQQHKRNVAITSRVSAYSRATDSSVKRHCMLPNMREHTTPAAA